MALILNSSFQLNKAKTYTSAFIKYIQFSKILALLLMYLTGKMNLLSPDKNFKFCEIIVSGQYTPFFFIVFICLMNGESANKFLILVNVLHSYHYSEFYVDCFLCDSKVKGRFLFKLQYCKRMKRKWLWRSRLIRKVSQKRKEKEPLVGRLMMVQSPPVGWRGGL